MSDIATLRKTVGLSQSQFADKFDIPVRTLQQWEQGRSAPPSYVKKMIETLASLPLSPLSASASVNVRNVRFHRLPTRSTWKVCISRPFQNCEHIYPIQQRKIRAILDRVADNPAVNKVIVFGSSVTKACHSGSDVDIYFDLNDDVKIPLSDLGFDIDAWSNYSVDDRLKSEIDKKGVIVYG